MSLRFEAPTGYIRLKQQVVYTVVRRDVQKDEVQLVGFQEVTNKKGHVRYKAHFFAMSWSQLLKGRKPPKPDLPAPVQIDRKPRTLPFWHAGFEGTKLDELTDLTEPRGKKEISVRDECERRLAQISPAVERAGQILSARDPLLALNKLADEGGVNQIRFKLWFFLYLAFDRNLWALMPDRARAGKWKRTDPKHKKSTFGTERKYFSGTPTSWLSETDVDGIAKDFKDHAERGDTWIDVWSKALRRRGVLIVDDGDKPTAVPRPGQTVYSVDRMRYYSQKKLGKAFCDIRLYGAERVESEAPSVKGGQSDGILALGQQCHYDASHVAERPRAYLGKFAMPPLLTYNLVDGCCAHIEGVGFSLGSETSRGYRYALFCAAISKSKFGQIIGYPISDKKWKGKGLPASLFSDRGAGNSDDIRAAVDEFIAGMGMSRSRTPWDNSRSEGKNKRKKKKVGAPEYRISDLTVMHLMHREVERVILKNHSESVDELASDQAVVEGGVSTPAEYREYLEEVVCRTDLVQISFEDAVRAFLDEVEVKCKEAHLLLKTRTYRIPAGLEKALPRARKDLQLKAYAYQLATRFIWIEFKGRLYEVEAFGNDRPEVLNASLPELENIAAARGASSGERRALKPIRGAAAHQNFERESGKDWHKGRVVSGPPKVKKQALDEARRINSLT